jgi:hypothetical protein
MDDRSVISRYIARARSIPCGTHGPKRTFDALIVFSSRKGREGLRPVCSM